MIEHLEEKTITSWTKHTLNDGQQDNDDKEEEGDVKQYTVCLVGISIWWFYLISYTSSSSHTLIQVEHKALKQTVSHSLVMPQTNASKRNF